MSWTTQYTASSLLQSGSDMYALIERLYPICRSITGNGLRQSLAILREYLPLEVHEVPSGTQVFDWTIPREWNIRDAYIKNEAGERVVDFRKLNLHVLNYSIPVAGTFTFEALKPHLFTEPEKPALVPYRTSYYQENWGFCLSQQQYDELATDPLAKYEVLIDSSLEAGHLTYGEYYLPGQCEEEVLISTHICHPSLCNDNLSGMAVVTALASYVSRLKNRYSYRFLFIPGTIGSISWLARNEEKTPHIRFGLVASLLGDSGPFTYKKSRRGTAEIDHIVAYVLEQSGYAFQIQEFIPYGYDERQFCSPGFNLPVGNLTRTPFAQYPEYHTSADNLSFVKPENLQASLEIYREVVHLIERNRSYLNQYPKCEPQLGKRGLYDAIGGSNDRKQLQMAMLWILNLSDGEHSLLDIARKSGIPFDLIWKMAQILTEKSLITSK